jgi:branched-chain amino acid transport system substrate-binding protein
LIWSRAPLDAIALIGASAAAAGLLAGCGSKQDQPGARIAGSTLTVYVSAPLNGPSSVSGRAIMNGARLAVDRVHARIGRYRIAVKPLDDSTPASLEWDPGQTLTGARLAVLDPTTIGYVGDLDSGASAVSIPVLNRAGIAQISPTSTAVGLTFDGPGAAPGEPFKYYPTGARTFARVAPSDEVQAAVQVSLQRSFGCARTYVVDDGEVDGEDMATSFDLAARAAGLDVVATQQYEQKANNYRSLASSIATTTPNCVLITAITDANAALLTRQLAAGVPGARIFATAGEAESTYASAIPDALDGRILITAPALGASAYPPSGRAFLASYAARFGTPEPDAILGYEGMSLMLSAVTQATDQGTQAAQRSKVVRAIFATRDRQSVLGRYSIDSNGDTTSRTFGVWTIVDGRLHFWKAVDG